MGRAVRLGAHTLVSDLMSDTLFPWQNAVCHSQTVRLPQAGWAHPIPGLWEVRHGTAEI